MTTRALCGWFSGAVIIPCLTVAATLLNAQAGAPNGEWKTYGADLSNTHYSALDQIKADNFNRLQIAWRFKTDNLGPRPEFRFESTPLMANGVLYSTAGSRRDVIALDPATGELLWSHREDEGARAAASPRALSGRGLAYWTDGKDERIIYVTIGYRLVSLDAKTGTRVSTFGQDGLVDMKTFAVMGIGQPIDLVKGEIGTHTAPAVTKSGVILVGSAFLAGGRPKTHDNTKGMVLAFDIHTGKKLWQFHTIPEPGEYGNETWLKDSWAFNGNTGSWGQISVDEDLGLAYLPIEMPTGDYYGGHRPGNGLFGETLVAVDLKTGKRKWHYQLVHHGIWDNDIPSAPMLLDLTINGRTVKAVAQPTKQCFLYVFDRVTGTPIWPIVETPVPQGNVPGEWYSPTQPIPTKPPAYERQGSREDDLIDFTPELRAEALKLVSKYKMGPLFTPPVASKAEGPLATIEMPADGSNWPGGSYDPETHMLYVFSAPIPRALGLLPNSDPKVSDMSYVAGTASQGRGGGADAGEGGGGGLTVQGLPLFKPPYARITAYDMDKGEIRWQVPHGTTPDNIRNSPALKGINVPSRLGNTNSQGTTGTLTTKTLVVSGESIFTTTETGARGAMLRAYDKATGKDAGAVFMPAPQGGAPMTYMLNGKQYIVVTVGGANYPGEILAYRLPN
jgi:quinoprotein glucose dehydrogenase